MVSIGFPSKPREGLKRQVCTARTALAAISGVGAVTTVTVPARPSVVTTLRIAEVDLHLRGYRKVFVFGHLQSAVPGQRASQRSGEFTNLLTQSRHHRLGLVAGHLDQHGKARMTLAPLDRRKPKPFSWPHTTPPLKSRFITDGVAPTH